MIKTISPNLIGKDYICSDLHGHFHLLQQKLHDVDFNEECDRVFGLGDLINRGDQSDLVLAWLAKPWFFSVQGNHERMLINFIESRSESVWHRWMMWGGDWAENLSYSELQVFYDALIKLPIAIELELDASKKVGLVHAELPNKCDWRDIKDILLATDSANIDSQHKISDMLWSRSQPTLSDQEMVDVEMVKNIDHVFHGHTIVENYLTIANRTFMDLGSYATGHIGFISPSEFLHSLDQSKNGGWAT